MTAEEYFEYDQDTIPFKECSTRYAEEYDYNGEEPPYSKYEMIAFAKGYYEKQLALCDVVKSFTAEQVVKELEDCETLDDAIMFFKEHK